MSAGRSSIVLAATPTQLAGMLDVSPEPRWTVADLRAMLAHQLGMPLARMLADEGIIADVPGTSGPGNGAAASPVSASATLGDVLFAAEPVTEALDAVRRWGKNLRDQPGPLCEIRRAVYFAALAVARVKQGQVRSSLPAAELRAGWRWLGALAWVDPRFSANAAAALALP